MKNRWIIIVSLILILGILISGCAPAAAPVESPKEEEQAKPAESLESEESAEQVPVSSGEKKLIGISSFQQGNDWNIQVAEGAKERVDELGWEYVHTNAEGDTDAMITALEGFLSQGVDGVVVGGGSAPALEPIIGELQKAGIPVVTLDITSQNAVTNIFIESHTATALLAVYAVNRLDALPGSYAHLTIPDFGWKTVDIRDFVADLVFEIEGWENVGLLDSGLADAINQSKTAVRSALLAHPDLDLVYSSWGMPAVGAAAAIREAELTDQVFVVNTDADRIVLAEMAEPDSPIKGCIAQRPTDMGVMAVDYLNKALSGEQNIPKITYAPFYFVSYEKWLLPPGVEVLTPEEAWDALYPKYEFGQSN